MKFLKRKSAVPENVRVSIYIIQQRKTLQTQAMLEYKTNLGVVPERES